MVLKEVVIAAVLQVVTGETLTDPMVDTNVGSIKGLRADDGDYSMFLGIPYGKVDETNPFGAAKPYPKFQSTFKAFNDTTICPQIEEVDDTTRVIGTFDCLVLNVYVPSSASSKNPLPVFVFIHGGSFMEGDGRRYSYDPCFLLKQNILVVTINYRLGPYGFMCLDTPEVPGNQGLKDQVLALRWINNNIEAFGGDTNKITLNGESAGSIAVGLHLHSNSEKLFSQAILQSGTEKLPYPVLATKTTPVDIAEHLGYSTDSAGDAMEYLAKVDSHSVIDVVNELKLNFWPCIEKEFEDVESFITHNWITAKLPKLKNMPILIGFNSNEAQWLHMSLENQYYVNSKLRDSLALEFNVDAKGFEGMEDMVRHFYFGDQPLTPAVKQSFVDFDSDFMFVHPTYRSIAKYLEYGAGKIYFYVFSYTGERNFFKDIFDYTGATHADELFYLFDASYMKNELLTPEDNVMINQITTMWANFVKFGNPTPQTSDFLQIEWTPIKNLSQMPYLSIDSQLSLESRPFNRRVTFWDLFYRANKNYLIAHNS